MFQYVLGGHYAGHGLPCPYTKTALPRSANRSRPFPPFLHYAPIYLA
jgi:hypothetical protein